MPRLLILFLCLFMLPGFSSQPLDERSVQDNLPQSHDEMWRTLSEAEIKFDDQKEIYTAVVPSSIKALVGKEMTISGFILPLEANEKFKHFLLSKRTPTCPYCPPGEPDEIIDVYAVDATEWDENLVTYQGTFQLMGDGESGLFFKLEQAVKK